MKFALVNLALGVALLGGLPSSARCAEQEAKALPTLLIKGEVVSLDTSDATASTLKVKDRYGFETPIFLSQETKITKGDAALTSASLTAGTAVEVEYNFDVNTAKRHAVTVKVVPAPKTTATAVAPAAAAAARPAASPAVQVPPAAATTTAPSAPEAPATTVPPQEKTAPAPSSQ